jgi:ABC-type methionine transport system permease subunit
MKLLGYTITAYLVQLATGLLLFIPIGLGIAITHPETHRFVVLLNDVTLWVIAPLLNFSKSKVFVIYTLAMYRLIRCST